MSGLRPRNSPGHPHSRVVPLTFVRSETFTGTNRTEDRGRRGVYWVGLSGRSTESVERRLRQSEVFLDPPGSLLVENIVPFDSGSLTYWERFSIFSP